jgi:hypothetical protein
MNEKNDFALVRRPSSAVEKAAPGAKRILSGMVTDTLALRKKHSKEHKFWVAICGNDGDLDGRFTSYLQKILADDWSGELNGFTYADEAMRATDQKLFELCFEGLKKAAKQKLFDLFFVFLNLDLPLKPDRPEVREFFSNLESKFQNPIIIISREVIYTRQMSSSLVKTGADAFSSMPFDLEHFETALTTSGIKFKD